MVLVEGDKADGATVDHDVFPVAPSSDSATPSAADQVVQAVLGTQESAEAGGHHLAHVGVTWTDHTEAAALRDALAAHGIADVMLVSELHAASALAQAAGAAVGYQSTALLFLDRDTATLSVVNGDDGSVVKVLSRSLHSTDAMAVLADMAAAVAGQSTAPQGMFIVGSGVDVSSVKEHLEHLVDIPVSAPEESELALARGAALAAANAPTFEASTVGLAYSQDPDGPTAGSAYAAMAAADTQLAMSSAEAPLFADDVDAAFAETPAPVEEGRKPFFLVGSALMSIFVVGVVALAVSLAVSIRPTADQRPSPAQNAVAPSAPPVAPAPAPEAAPVQSAAPAPPPAAETIKAPIPVVQEAPAPRKVYVEQAPAPQAPAPEPAAPPPAPAPEAPPAPPVVAPPVVVPPPVIVWPRPQVPVWRPPWDPGPKQQDPSDDDYPGQYPGGYPGQYPGGSNGGYPGQYPGGANGGYPGGYPGNGGGNGGYPGQYPGGSNGGYPGSGNQGGNGPGGGRGDHGDGPKKSGPCFLIFCAPR